jgi:two-component system sensor histidine kinase MtrB
MDSAAVAVSVRDYGVGLRPGEEQLVFDRFWRADPARARTSGGTGLGLAIALEDARLHGGWLEAWGESGQGSVFRLTLPRVVGGDLHGSPLPLRPLPLTAVADGLAAGDAVAADGTAAGATASGSAAVGSAAVGPDAVADTAEAADAAEPAGPSGQAATSGAASRG